MKKILFTAALLTLSFSLAAQTDSTAISVVKIGYIDSDSILTLHPQKKKIDRHLQDATAEYESEYKRMKSDYNKKVKDYLKNNGELLNSIKLARQAEITEAEKRIAAYKMQYQQQLQHERDSLTRGMQHDIALIVNQVAAEQNITVVLDKKNALYLAPNCIDLFPFVEKKLLQK